MSLVLRLCTASASKRNGGRHDALVAFLLLLSFSSLLPCSPGVVDYNSALCIQIFFLLSTPSRTHFTTSTLDRQFC